MNILSRRTTNANKKKEPKLFFDMKDDPKTKPFEQVLHLSAQDLL